ADAVEVGAVEDGLAAHPVHLGVEQPEVVVARVDVDRGEHDGRQDPRARQDQPDSSGPLGQAAPTFSLTTRLEPPGCMVTPYSTSAASMVRFWWLTMTSCASSRNSFTRPRKRWRLTSSRAASTSSMT